MNNRLTITQRHVILLRPYNATWKNIQKLLRNKYNKDISIRKLKATHNTAVSKIQHIGAIT